MAKKFFDNLDDIATLIELAEKPKAKPVKIKKENPDVLKFIEELKISSGKKRIPTYIIYYQYSEWKKTRLISRNLFFRHFGKKFEKTKTVDGLGYLLNPTAFDLTPQGYFKARLLLRRERDARQKEKNKTKSN